MEIFKDIPNYPNYKASNLGRIKSLNYEKERILKYSTCKNNYCRVVLYENKISKSFQVHQLVAMAFLKHNPNGHNLVVNHKDFNPLNNNVDNLEIVTHRINCNKKHLKSSSKFAGVTWVKNRNKWSSRINIKNKTVHLGSYKNEYDAHLAYQKALNNI